jgi:hypothetical protein
MTSDGKQEFICRQCSKVACPFVNAEDRHAVVECKSFTHHPIKEIGAEKKYFSVQMTYRQEVCVKAKDESEAEEIARSADFSTSFMDLQDADAEELYNDPGDEHLVKEFKEQDRYAEDEEN